MSLDVNLTGKKRRPVAGRASVEPEERPNKKAGSRNLALAEQQAAGAPKLGLTPQGSIENANAARHNSIIKDG